MKKYPVFWLALVLFSLALSNCSLLRIESSWKQRDIVIDGIGGDWLGAKYYFEDYALSVGLINDEKYLYVSIITENPMVRAQIMRQGLTVWLDPKGGKNKTFGIQYPLGRQENEQEAERMDPQDVMDEAAREKMMEKFRAALSELEVLGPGEKVMEKLPVEKARGIDVEVRDAAGTFVYELKVPLAASDDNPYAVGVEAGDEVGVGILSPKLEMRRPRGEPGMGRPGMGGGMPPAGAGMRGMGRFSPRQLKIWAKVRLASAANPALSFF